MSKQEILEWCAVFAFLHWEHDDEEWYNHCAEEAFRHEDKQIHLFWWSLRRYYSERDDGWIGWREYLDWKNQSMGLSLPVDMEQI